MIVHYCDICGSEITANNEGKLIKINHGHKYKVLDGEIRMTIEDMEDPDLCKYCVFDVISKYDDRPVERQRNNV